MFQKIMSLTFSTFQQGDGCEICSDPNQEPITHNHVSSGLKKEINHLNRKEKINLVLGDSMTNNMKAYNFKSEIMLESF